VSLTTELLRNFEEQINHFTLVPSDGGRFEVLVNGQLIFSKKQSGRHANPGEVTALLQKYIEEKQV
jgi:selenoprotein W-related protein